MSFGDSQKNINSNSIITKKKGKNWSINIYFKNKLVFPGLQFSTFHEKNKLPKISYFQVPHGTASNRMSGNLSLLFVLFQKQYFTENERKYFDFSAAESFKTMTC